MNTELLKKNGIKFISMYLMIRIYISLVSPGNSGTTCWWPDWQGVSRSGRTHRTWCESFRSTPRRRLLIGGERYDRQINTASCLTIKQLPADVNIVIIHVLTMRLSSVN